MSRVGSTREHHDALKTAKSLVNTFTVFRISTQGLRMLAAMASEVAWTLLCVVRNASEAKMAAKQELVCVKQQLYQKEGDAASILLVSL